MDRISLARLNDLERRVNRLESRQRESYETANVTPTRSFDADTVTLEQLADVLGTLIEDLRRKGTI